jgi:hypothetical protein
MTMQLHGNMDLGKIDQAGDANEIVFRHDGTVLVVTTNTAHRPKLVHHFHHGVFV